MFLAQNLDFCWACVLAGAFLPGVLIPSTSGMLRWLANLEGRGLLQRRFVFTVQLTLKAGVVTTVGCLRCIANLEGRGRKTVDCWWGSLLVIGMKAVFTDVRGCKVLNNVKTVPSGQVAQCLHFTFLLIVVEAGLDNDLYCFSLRWVRRILKEKT